jgi:hypothetical protein
MTGPQHDAPKPPVHRGFFRRIVRSSTIAAVVFMAMAAVVWLHPTFLFGSEPTESAESENLPAHADNYLEIGTTPTCDAAFFRNEVLEGFLDWTQLNAKHPGASDRLQLTLTKVETLQRDEDKQKQICRAVAVLSPRDQSIHQLAYPVVYSFDAGSVNTEFSNADGSGR